VTEGDKPEGRSWTTIFNVVMMVIGGIALAWMLRTTSWGELQRVVFGIGAWTGSIFAFELASTCCDAKAIHTFMQPEARMVSYLRVLASYASGRAINVLTPFGALGEATKVSLLMSHAPRSRVLSSLVLHNLSILYLNVAAILLGIPLTLLLLDLPDFVKMLALIGAAVLVPLMVGLGVIIQRGATSTVVGVLRQVHLISADRATDWKSKLVDVDKHIRELHRHRTKSTRTGLLFVLASKLLSWTSTLILAHAIGVHLTPALVVAMLSVGVLIQWISNIVPLGLGIADGGNYALYALLGASGEQGMFVALLSRARSVAFAVIGLGAMVVLQVEQRLAHARIHRKIDELKAIQSQSGEST
jgi:hypothetical protein